MEIILAAIAGILAGFLAGLLPGVNVTFIMIVATPFLYGVGLLPVLAFYMGVSSASQYSGSIVALFLKIPGESTSLPAVGLSNHFNTPTLMRQAIYNTATGSLIGSMMAVALTVPIFYFFQGTTAYLKTTFIVAIGCLSIILCMIVSTNRWWETAVMLTFGWIISKVGYDLTNNTQFLTFGNSYLMGGIPMISVMVSLFALPCLVALAKSQENFDNLVKIKNTKVEYFNKSDLGWPSVRGSLVGYIMGLVPYIGTAMSSNIAYFVEKILGPRRYSAQLTSAETANNSAAFSALAPLLMFGVAILPSEFVLLEILNYNAQKINWNIAQNILTSLMWVMVFINLVCWIMSYYSVNFAVKIFKMPKWTLLSAIAVALIASVWYGGELFSQEWYYLACMILLAPIGYMLYKKDTMPIVLGFLLQNNMDDAIVRLWKLL